MKEKKNKRNRGRNKKQTDRKNEKERNDRKERKKRKSTSGRADCDRNTQQNDLIITYITFATDRQCSVNKKLSKCRHT